VRSDDQIISLDHEIMHRSDRHVELERLPVAAIVEREVDSQLCPSEKQTFAHRILTYRANVSTAGNAGCDLRPGCSGIARAIDMRSDVGQAMAVNGGVGSRRVEMGGLDDADLAPRRQPWRRDISPILARITAKADATRIRAHPNQSGLQRGRRNRVDHSVATL